MIYLAAFTTVVVLVGIKYGWMNAVIVALLVILLEPKRLG